MKDRLVRQERGAAAGLLAAFLIAVGFVGSAAAQASDPQFCTSYAANTSGMAGLAIKKNPACLDYSKGVHDNFKMHYDWCLKQPQASVQGAETNIRRLVTLCTGSATNQGAQGDVRFCQSYAANVSGIGGLAIKKNPACLDYSKGVHGDYKMHYDWCLKQSQASVQGAETNIRRLVTLCTGNAASPAPANAARPSSEEEPFGAGFDGWKFTQASTDKGILCRAWFGQNVIARYPNTNMYVSVPAGKIVPGSYPETFFQIGNDSEPVTAKSNGKRFWLESDPGFLNKLASAPGFNYRTGPVNGKFMTGQVTFNGSTGKALKELQACSKANGGG